ncbi:hypothetical protein MPH_02575 [Macrophomina phaseolina MS6]|uniref:Uncharacterized protein n=1 Tax=Macrophomina phaseolina (strain MS6) TaxID=1126212 RepID=K2STT0_MACPH|nr:hypothetical protein MPH_02575 [Macrophomina phaseolina MS6]
MDWHRISDLTYWSPHPDFPATGHIQKVPKRSIDRGNTKRISLPTGGKKKSYFDRSKHKVAWKVSGNAISPAEYIDPRKRKKGIFEIRTRMHTESRQQDEDSSNRQ